MGGLEKLKDFIHIAENVHRRIGGLENSHSQSQSHRQVHRRIGGLERYVRLSSC